MSKNVLVVDDDRDCLELASISLRLFGDWQVYQAINEDIALKKAKELLPDVILLDYYINETTGGEVIKRIREVPELVSIPIVVYSGSPAAARKDPYVTDDIEVLAKPLNPESLSEVLRRLCKLDDE